MLPVDRGVLSLPVICPALCRAFLFGLAMNYQLLIEQTKHFEGLELLAYLCTERYWTIGYGRNLETNGLSKDEQIMLFGQVVGKPFYVEHLKTNAITEEQAEALLLADLSLAEEQCHARINMTMLNDARKAVFIGMCFQMGINGLLGFRKAIDHACSEHYESAAHEMLNSRWSMQTPTRAKKMANQMATGEWQ